MLCLFRNTTSIYRTQLIAFHLNRILQQLKTCFVTLGTHVFFSVWPHQTKSASKRRSCVHHYLNDLKFGRYYRACGVVDLLFTGRGPGVCVPSTHKLNRNFRRCSKMCTMSCGAPILFSRRFDYFFYTKMQDAITPQR